MNDIAKIDAVGTRAVMATDGEFAGWWTWPRDTFEANSGPFWYREEDGRMRCAFRSQKKHLNGQGYIHGGCLMTFADFCLFALAARELAGSWAVTVSFSAEFIDAAGGGELIETSGEVIRAGRSLLFVRGLVSSGARPLLNFSGTIKRVGKRPG